MGVAFNTDVAANIECAKFIDWSWTITRKRLNVQPADCQSFIRIQVLFSGFLDDIASRSSINPSVEELSVQYVSRQRQERSH